MISLMVIKAGWGNTVSALYELADKGIDDEVKASVSKAVKKSFTNLKDDSQVELREVQGVKSGQNYLIDLELAVPKSWTVEDVREVEEVVRLAVGSKVRGARRIRVRFVPNEDSATTLFDEFISGSVSPRDSPVPDLDHDVENGNRNGNKKKVK